jgi:DNA-binding IclR family transcriptional regulator
MAEIVSRGWAAEAEEAILGEAGVAAPIFDARGQAAGAIGVTGPTERLTTRRGTPHATAGRDVVAAARSISRELGAPRWPAHRATGAA